MSYELSMNIVNEMHEQAVEDGEFYRQCRLATHRGFELAQSQWLSRHDIYSYDIENSERSELITELKKKFKEGWETNNE